VGAYRDGGVLWAFPFTVWLLVLSCVAYAACLFTLKASGRLAQLAFTYGCFATLASPADVRGVVEFDHPVIEPSALFWGAGKVEVGLEGPPQCCDAWERFPYRGVLVLTVYYFHIPHFFRHFGRDLGKVFWASYMHEAV